MRLIELNLTPGVPAPEYGLGRYVRLLGGAGSLEVEVVYTHDTIRSQMLPGIGVDMSHPETRERFKEIRLKSDTAQTVPVLITEWPTADNRQQGGVSILSNNSVTGQPERVLTGAAEAIPANALRKKIYLSAPDLNAGRIWIGASAANNGLPLEAGDVLLLEISGAVEFIGTAGDVLHVCEVV